MRAPMSPVFGNRFDLERCTECKLCWTRKTVKIIKTRLGCKFVLEPPRIHRKIVENLAVVTRNNFILFFFNHKYIL